MLVCPENVGAIDKSKTGFAFRSAAMQARFIPAPKKPGLAYANQPQKLTTPGLERSDKRPDRIKKYADAAAGSEFQFGGSTIYAATNLSGICWRRSSKRVRAKIKSYS